MAQTENGEHGPLLAAISNRIVALQRQYYGRGATRAKTIMNGDIVVCVMEDIYISAERTLIDSGRFEAVQQTRSAFQDAIAPQFKAAVEELTGRSVIAFMSQNHANPDLSVEFFKLGTPLEDTRAAATERPATA